MPNNLNEISCGGNGSGNLGLTPCSYTALRTIGLIAAPIGATIPTSAFASTSAFYAFLITKLQAPLYANRWFIIGQFEDQESQGQDVTFYSSPGSRLSTPVQDPTRKIRYQLSKGFCYHKQLYAINGTGYKYFEIFKSTQGDYLIKATSYADPITQLVGVFGITANMLYVEPPTAATATTPELYHFQLEDADINESTVNRSVFKIDGTIFNALQPLAVKDVKLEYRGTTGAGVYIIRPELSCGSISLVEQIPALASATYILVFDNSTGTAVTPTTVAVDPADPANVIMTLPTGAGTLRFELAGLSVLLTPIGAYESGGDNKLIIPRT